MQLMFSPTSGSCLNWEVSTLVHACMHGHKYLNRESLGKLLKHCGCDSMFLSII